MDSTRSTSPPKSACPGVSTMLMRYSVLVRLSSHLIAVFLALEIVAVHDPLAEILAGIQGLGLPQQLVHERGLAVVDVGDDGDIAEVLNAHGSDTLKARCCDAARKKIADCTRAAMTAVAPPGGRRLADTPAETLAPVGSRVARHRRLAATTKPRSEAAGTLSDSGQLWPPAFPSLVP